MFNFQNRQIQNDQAAGLRRIMTVPKPRVVSILSASSTQDQARLMTNLAASIGVQGIDVLIVHASHDSSETSYEIKNLPTLLDVSQEKSMLIDVIRTSKHGFSVAKLMPKNETNSPLDSKVSGRLNTIFDELALQYEIVLVDVTLNKNDILPLKTLNEGEIIIKLTRQSESIKDAYTLIKQICSQLGRRSFGIIVDNATDAQAQIVFRNISQVARRFMQIELEFFGAIPSDDHLSRAAKLGRSVIDAFPLATASAAFKQIAQRFDYKQDYAAETKLASIL
jgi:flagellar biosynthesis protein FlhG